MVRSLALGFGVATALAVAGSLTPRGQAMFGFRHPVTETAAPVTAIQDKPASVPAPAASSTPQMPQPPRAMPVPPEPPHPAPQAAQRHQGTPQGAAGGLAGVANILLNLPQVLDQTHVGPSRGSDSWSQSPGDSKPAKAQRKHRNGDDDSKDAGDGGH